MSKVQAQPWHGHGHRYGNGHSRLAQVTFSKIRMSDIGYQYKIKSDFLHKIVLRRCQRYRHSHGTDKVINSVIDMEMDIPVLPKSPFPRFGCRISDISKKLIRISYINWTSVRCRRFRYHAKSDIVYNRHQAECWVV
jgi:hypothetical protein